MPLDLTNLRRLTLADTSDNEEAAGIVWEADGTPRARMTHEAADAFRTLLARVEELEREIAPLRALRDLIQKIAPTLTIPHYPQRLDDFDKLRQRLAETNPTPTDKT